MPAGELLDVAAEALAGDSPLEVDRKQPILPAGQYRGGEVGPRGEGLRLGEDRRAFCGGVGIGTHDLDQLRR